MTNEPKPTLEPGTSGRETTQTPRGGQNPTAPEGLTGLRGGSKMYGFCSIETFCDQGSLSLTHDDAQGFYQYVNQFTPPNFWYKDSGVKPWIYYEQYDNWQDTYGADAVRVFYHSGHGGMSSDGTFYLPMGADWGGLGCTALSSNMRLGNETLRYLFWSTCLSLRISGGHSPIRTWNQANLGLRMIFGYETTSYDNANYGRYFFEEWNKNKSFSQAFLDASWRISHHQSPSVVACGASQEEAKNRVFNERLFYAESVSKNWWWWRWYSAAMAREVTISPPESLQFAELVPVVLSASDLFDRFGMRGPVAEDGSTSFVEGQRSFSRSADGSFSIQLAAANLENTVELAVGAARAAAERLIARLALSADQPLVLDRIIRSQAAGGSLQGSGELVGSHTTETIIQYRQIIAGLPVISSDVGALRVAIDNDGNVVRVEGHLRQVANLINQGRRTPPQQPEPADRRGAPGSSLFPEPLSSFETGLAQKTTELLRSLIARGPSPVGYTIVPGSTEIGYDIKGDIAQLIACRSIEIQFLGGYRKLYHIETPIFG
jgi:Family of unknown function (DUF6345)